jgi:Zn-finger nucleic acid-binding protein
MQTVSRGGVEFDMCPQCRGVWLDRGELEKLMEAATSSAAQYSPAPPTPAPQPAPHAAPHHAPWGAPPQPSYPPPQHGGHYGHGHDPYYYKKKKKKLDIFDIFD